MHLEHSVEFVESIQRDNSAFDHEGADEFLSSCIRLLLDRVRTRSETRGEIFAAFRSLSHSVYRGSQETIVSVVGIYIHIS